MKLSNSGFIIGILCSCLILQSCQNKNSNAAGIAVNGKEAFSDSAVSTIKIYNDAQGRKVIQKNNTYYDLVDFIDKEDIKKLLIKITKAETSYVDSGTKQNHFIVSVSNIAGGKTNWSKEFAGADIDYTNKVLVVHTEGKGSDQEDTYTQYSLQSGQKLMSYTYADLMALIPNTNNRRFFGYLSKQSAIEEHPEQFATISYVGSNEIIDLINVKVKGVTDMPIYTPEIKMLVAQESGNSVSDEGKTAILAHANRTYKDEDISNFAMLLIYTRGDRADTVLIPVRNDRVDLKNASFNATIFDLQKAN